MSHWFPMVIALGLCALNGTLVLYNWKQARAWSRLQTMYLHLILGNWHLRPWPLVRQYIEAIRQEAIDEAMAAAQPKPPRLGWIRRLVKGEG